MTPSSVAMRAAVRGWSPVIMMIRRPAPCASPIATGASGRGGSMMPTMPKVDELVFECFEPVALPPLTASGRQLDVAGDLGPARVGEAADLPGHALVRAACQQHVGRTLGHHVDAPFAFDVGLEGAHELALRRERQVHERVAELLEQLAPRGHRLRCLERVRAMLLEPASGLCRAQSALRVGDEPLDDGGRVLAPGGG
jgi:hypothetical protein